MEGQSFDRFARSLASGSSRRGFLRGLFRRGASVTVASIAGAAVVGAVQPEEALATGECPGNKICNCVCQAGTTDCGNDYCADLQVDEQHCGACNNVCGANEVCSSGACVCDTNFINCDGVCVDKRTSENCGACGVTCPVDGYCHAGAFCRCSTAGWTFCPISATEGYCADTSSDESNCGGCGSQASCSGCGVQNECGAGVICYQGDCGCPSGSSTCGQTCKWLQFDVDNCGACGNVCPDGILRQCCNGSCSNKHTDSSNCGSCGNACPTNTICQSGSCTCPTWAGYTVCGQGCVDTQTDSANCGGCGVPCDVSETCTAGVCV